eukprot:symbB.v1.2.019822.t1/scaffold1639.1/size107980/2
MLLNFLVVLLTLCEVSKSQSQKRTREASPRRAASPVDAFGTPVPSSLAIPDIPQALPPARLTSTAGYLELELVLGFIDLEAECEAHTTSLAAKTTYATKTGFLAAMAAMLRELKVKTLDGGDLTVEVFPTTTMDELKALLHEKKHCEDPMEHKILKVKVLTDGLLVDDDQTVESAGLLHDESEVTAIFCRNEVEAAKKKAIHAKGFLQVNIPNSLTEISVGAFYCCNQVVKVAIPQSVTAIGLSAFRNCKSLASITIPESVTAIADFAFSNCSSMESITIPESVTSIGVEAFRECKCLASIRIPESVTAIQMFCFANCRSLKRITIPNAVTVIEECAFASCESLESVTIPESVTSIEGGAFSNCESLESITIPQSVTAIGDGAFRDCSSLTSITIPESVTSIEAGAFANCESLESITIPQSVTAIGQSAFRNCKSLASITIPESVTAIADFAFSDCSSMESITIPESVTAIGEGAFENCCSLESITIPEALRGDVFRNDADDQDPSLSCFRGSCVSIVRLPGLKVDAQYAFTMQIVRRVRDPASGLWFEFHGQRSRPITFVTAGLPDWQLAIPQTTSLGSIVMRLSWEEPMTGGSAILGYQVEMETDVTPGWHTIYDGSLDPNVKHLVLENLTYGTTYFYNVYSINAIGRSKPISTAYTVAEPLEKTFFYPLATDPSIPNATLPDAIVADIPTELVILAKNPVTKRIEEGSTHRNYLAAIYDACELNVMRSLCLPVPEQHPDYQDHRQRVKRTCETPDCCHVTTANGDGTYSLTYTGNKTGIYSLMVYTIFPNGLWGQYWDNNWFYGLPVVSRVDSEIHFQWGQQEVTALAGDHITARWVGFLQGPSTNEYTIYVKADDSVKVWIQGELVVDYWDSEEPCCPEHWTRQNLVKDQFYSIRVDWKEVQGNAQLRLMWGVTGKRKQIIPSQYLWRGAPLENTPYRIVVVPGEPSAVTSGLVEPLERVRSSVKQIVYFEALDVRGNTVNSTNVTFEAYFYFLGSNDTLPLIFRSTPLMLKRRSADEWLHDHLHYMEFVLMQPGNYTLELYLQDIGQLANSPLEIMAMQDDVQPQMCTVSGPGALSFTAGVETNFTLQLRDAFGNAVPHIDGIEVTVDLAFVEEINPNGTLNDRQFRNLTGGHYTTANSITKGPHGSYFITYTGLRAGLNVLTVKVNGLLIAGEQEQVYYNPPVQGQNSPLDLIGYYNHRADGQMTIFSPARLPTECTTGVNCIVVFHMRDAYGNRMLDDFSAQLWYHIVDANCDPRDPYDPLCVPVDQGVCVHLFGEMHSCDLIPTVGGQFLLRLLVNGQDASFGTWSESVFIYTLEAPYTQGPTSLLVNIGDINATTSTMEGPGLDLAGNVVGVPVNVMVQMKDQYGNNRIVTGNDFQQRRTTVIASLGDTVLATEVHENGTITVTVQTLLAGYHRLRVRMGFGCFQADPVDLCDDISGSPSQLLWWKAAEVSENGMTCETPYIFEAGTQYHFTCTGRDVFSNLNPDYQLQLTADFEYIQAPEGREPLDGWFRGNASANFNQSFVGTYSAADSVYHFEPTVYRAGFYSIKIYLQRPEGGTAVLVLPNNVLALGRPAGDETIIVCVPSTPSPMSSVVVPFVTASATIANEVELQTRDRFGNAIEVSYGDIFKGLLYGQPQTSISFVHLFQGRFRGVLVPTTSGETLIDFMVNGESILGSPFDFVVTPGPMRIERSLVEGFPTEVTAGKLSCWNITLRDGNGNHRMSGLFPDSTDLEEVTCSDPESFCNHTELNGTFTCCINKTRIQDDDNNFRVDEFPFACQVRGDNIDPEVNVKLNPHPLSPLWPDSSNKTGYGMLGPYDAWLTGSRILFKVSLVNQQQG